MNIEFDAFDRAPSSPIVLTKPNRKRIGVLNGAYDIAYGRKFNAVNELTFSYPKYIIRNGKKLKNDYYDSLTGMKNIFVQDKGYFIVASCSEVIDGVNLIKSVTCYSLEFELSKKKLNLLSGTYKFYDPLDLDNCIIGKALAPAKGWSVGTIDSDLWNIYRTFDINDTNVYNFLMSDVEEAFQCIFEFDTVNKTVSAKSFENVIKETDIFFSFNNLMNNANLDENIDELVTVLKVYGSGNLSIHSVNPTGTAAIYDFSYFKNNNWMSEELIAALDAWEAKYEQAKIDYGDLLVSLKTENSSLVVLNGELYDLQQELKTLELILKSRVEVGIEAGDVTDDIGAKQAEIENKEAEIGAVEARIEALSKQMSDINLEIAFENNFTEEQLLELTPFMIENTYQNDSFLTTTIMTEVEKQVMAENLYEVGLETLDRLAQPRYTVSIDSVNYLYLKEFYHFTSQTELGCSITIELEDERRVELILLEININEDSPDDFTLVFGNRYRITSEELTFAELIGSVATLGNTISWDSVSWNEASAYIEDTVSKFINSALDCSKNEVINASNQEIIINEAGLRGRKATADGYDDKQVWLINNVLAFTRDNWQTSSLALGEIVMPDGSSAYGLVAEAVVGKLIAGNQLTIANENSTFMVDGSGASLVNGSFIMQTASGNGKIILNPTEGIKIQGLTADGSALEDKFYVDDKGNVVLKGSLTAGSTITGATFTGGSLSIGNGALVINEDGSLDIGNGNFHVDAAGNMTAKSGSFEGDIAADKITGEIASNQLAKTLNGKDLVGGSLNIGNGAFVVDSNGNVTIKRGSISWGAVTGTDSIDAAIADAQDSASEAAEAAALAESNLIKLAKGQYTAAGTTFISGNTIYSPNIYGGVLSVRASGSTGTGAQLKEQQVQFYIGSQLVGYIESYTNDSSIPGAASGGMRIRSVHDGTTYRALRLSASGGVAISSDNGEIWFSDSETSTISLSQIFAKAGSGTAVFG